jgi:hypothetical protein
LPENPPGVQDTCDLPAPENFHIKAIGPDWVTLAWNGSPNIGDNRIRIYRVSDNLLLSTTIVPTGVLEANISIPANTQVKAVINSICLDGSHSPDVAERILTGVILDLVVTGFSDSNNSSTCPITGEGECEFNQNGVSVFKVTSGGFFARKFRIQPLYDNNRNLSKCFITAQPSSFINLYCNTNTVAPCIDAKITITVKQGITESYIGTITAFQNQGVNYLKADLEPNCQIDRLTSFNGRPAPPKGPTRDRNEEFITMGELSVSPNPFTDILEVYPEWPTEENVSLQLYNLSGQKVLDQQFPGGQDQYTLSTEKLSPGFYLLRIESDGQVQTLKVIKSE